MFSSTFTKCILAAVMLVAQVSAFAPMIIPITTGPTLDSKQAKAAGIGGISGVSQVSTGGLGAFSIRKNAKEAPVKEKKVRTRGSTPLFKKNVPKAKPDPKAKVTAKAKATPKSKATPAKKTTEKKEKPNFFIKTPWSK
eukprot:897844_1